VAVFLLACGGGGSDKKTEQPPPASSAVLINAGGPDIEGTDWKADTDNDGTGQTYTQTDTIDMSKITADPPPVDIFGSERYSAGGPFVYTIPGLTAGSDYTVTLYFAETYAAAETVRFFNVTINDVEVLTEYNISADAGGVDIAVAKEFTATANASGQVVIAFVPIADKENAKICGIKVAPKA
jgi:hypothetical protein